MVIKKFPPPFKAMQNRLNSKLFGPKLRKIEENEEDVQRDLLDGKGPTEVVVESSLSVTMKRISVPEFHRLPSFSQVDADGNGKIDKDEFIRALSHANIQVPEHIAGQIFDEVDIDHSGTLDRSEYTTWQTKTVDFARSLMLPRNVVQDQKNQRHLYKDFYSCKPPPIFMFAITLVEIAVFIYHFSILPETETMYNYGPPPLDSYLIYHPGRRHEVWRYITYVFTHSGYMHLINNIVVQLVLGVLLEVVHKWWRVLIIYFAGVLAGSLATSMTNPCTFLAGASGGVYALIFAHMSTVILNWPEMQHPWLRVLLFSVFITYDVGIACFYQYVLGRTTIVSYPAHIGGGVAGLLTGIHVLKNVKWEPWELWVWRVSVIIAAVLVSVAVGWNIFHYQYFPPTRACY